MITPAELTWAVALATGQMSHQMIAACIKHNPGLSVEQAKEKYQLNEVLVDSVVFLSAQEASTFLRENVALLKAKNPFVVRLLQNLANVVAVHNKAVQLSNNPIASKSNTMH